MQSLGYDAVTDRYRFSISAEDISNLKELIQHVKHLQFSPTVITDVELTPTYEETLKASFKDRGVYITQILDDPKTLIQGKNNNHCLVLTSDQYTSILQAFNSFRMAIWQHFNCPDPQNGTKYQIKSTRDFDYLVIMEAMGVILNEFLQTD